MLYADSPLLDRLAYVVMDEVHYLADRFRGAVWEEVIIHLPEAVRLVSLSATVSNAEEFGDWLQAVRGDTDVIVSEERPVPLEQHVLVKAKLLDLFDSSGQAATNRVNPELQRLARAGGRSISSRSARGRRGGDRAGTTSAAQGDAAHRAPRGGRAAAGQAPAAGDRLHLLARRLRPGRAPGAALPASGSPRRAERDEIRAIVEERARMLRDEDLAVLGYWEWLEGLERGVAAHHAGMLPGVQGDRRGALPAEAAEGRLRDRDPRARRQHARPLGRAREAREVQRRGARADHAGGVHPAHRPSRPPRHRRRGALRHPVGRRARPRGGRRARLAAQLPAELELPADLQHGRQPHRPVRPRPHPRRSSSSRSRSSRPTAPSSTSRARCASRRSRWPATSRRCSCHLGDFAEYAALRRAHRRARAAVVEGQPDARAARAACSASSATLRKAMRAHPCHGCAEREQHARWAERWWRLKQEHDQLSRQIRSRTGQVAKRFDRVAEVLESARLPRARRTRLARLDVGGAHPEAHLRRTRPARRRVPAAGPLGRPRRRRRSPRWRRHSSTSRDATTAASEFRLPRGRFRDAFDRTTDVWSELDDLERDHRLPGSEPAVAGARLGDARVGARRGPRRGARRHRPRGRRLRALHEAGRRPARPDLDRRRRRARRAPRARRSTRCAAASSPTARSRERDACAGVSASPRLIWCPRTDPRPLLPLWVAVLVAIAGGLVYDLGFPGAGIWPLAFVGIALALVSLIGRASWAAAARRLRVRHSRSTCSRCRGPRSTSGPMPWLALSMLESLFVAGGAVLIALAYRWVPRASTLAVGAPRLAAAARRRALVRARGGDRRRSRTAGSRGAAPRSASPRARSPTSSRGSGRPGSGSSWSRSSRASSSGCACADGSDLRTAIPVAALALVALLAARPGRRRPTGELRVASVQGNGPAGLLRRARAGRRARGAARGDRADPRRARHRRAALARGRLRHRPDAQPRRSRDIFDST